MGPPIFIHIHHQCAACGQLFRPGEVLVAMLYRNSSIEIHRTIVFTSRGSHCEQLIKGDMHNIFRKIPVRLSNRDTDETISVHTDCLQLFEQKCIIKDAGNRSRQKERQYRRLWMAGTRRYAWSEMPTLQFPSSTTLAIPPPDMISTMCGFQRAFPPEVIRLIQSYSQSHILWKYCSVLQLVRELDAAEADKAITYPLPEVLSWSRGSPPKLVQDRSHAGPFIRFTIDARGIKDIERFSDCLSSTDGEMPTPSCVFVVEQVETLSAAKIEFELGMSRLLLPESLQISVWSTPNPLHLREFTSSPYHPYHRLTAVSLDPNYCTGISFFMYDHCVFDIHGHSTRYSNHLEKFEYMSSMFDNELTWIYIPLTAQDKITAVGVRKNVTMDKPHYFTLTTKTGTIAVGTPHRKGPPGRLILYEMEKDERQPLNLIYETPTSGIMTLITTDADKQTVTTDADIHPETRPLPRAFFSSASLEGILNAHIFTDKHANLCKGILIEYENGSKRALGQCRLGWDSAQSWHKPLSFSYIPTSYKSGVEDFLHGAKMYKAVEVAFDSESSHVSEDGTLEPNYYAMKGCLNFWFTFNDVELQIV